MSENNDLYRKLTKFIEETSIKQSDDIKKHIKKEVEEIKEAINSEIAKRKELERELQEVKNKYKSLEKDLRKNNIIIFNLGYNEKDSILEFTVHKLNRLLEIDISRESINNIYTIGKKKENKPIIVKFTSYLTKQLVLKNGKKLKGTNISISEELTLDERKKQKILRQHLKKARSKRLNAYIKGEKLYINDEEYKPEELIENEEDSESEQGSENIEPQKFNSAPSTPNTQSREELDIGARHTDTQEDEKENTGNINKKKKINSSVPYVLPGRSSSRLVGKEMKQNSKNCNSPLQQTQK